MLRRGIHVDNVVQKDAGADHPAEAELVEVGGDHDAGGIAEGSDDRSVSEIGDLVFLVSLVLLEHHAPKGGFEHAANGVSCVGPGSGVDKIMVAAERAPQPVSVGPVEKVLDAGGRNRPVERPAVPAD